ncbi:MAG: thiamine phosphate synthase [Bacilli bacterium]
MIICITNRIGCKIDFLKKVEEIASKVDMIILREKDLTVIEYMSLASQVQKICKKKGVFFTINTFIHAFTELDADYLQLSYTDFCKMTIKQRNNMKIGVSVHSESEALNACKLGAKFIIVGHIFETNSKKGLEPKGVKLLRSIIELVDIPVYAVGGIDYKNMKELFKVGASGVCMMSYFMK